MRKVVLDLCDESLAAVPAGFVIVVCSYTFALHFVRRTLNNGVRVLRSSCRITIVVLVLRLAY